MSILPPRYISAVLMYDECDIMIGEVTATMMCHVGGMPMYIHYHDKGEALPRKCQDKCESFKFCICPGGGARGSSHVLWHQWTQELKLVFIENAPLPPLTHIGFCMEVTQVQILNVLLYNKMVNK